MAQPAGSAVGFVSQATATPPQLRGREDFSSVEEVCASDCRDIQQSGTLAAEPAGDLGAEIKGRTGACRAGAWVDELGRYPTSDLLGLSASDPGAPGGREDRLYGASQDKRGRRTETLAPEEHPVPRMKNSRSKQQGRSMTRLFLCRAFLITGDKVDGCGRH